MLTMDNFGESLLPSVVLGQCDGEYTRRYAWFMELHLFGEKVMPDDDECSTDACEVAVALRKSRRRFLLAAG